MNSKQSDTSSKQYGSRSFRARFESSLAGILFVATAVFYVGGTIAMVLRDSQLVA